MGALFGWITEIVGVRRVLARSDEHLWLLSTLALATMIQQAVGLWWGTEPKPFPRLIPQDFSAGLLDQKYWLPILVVILMAAGLELFYRRTMWGKLFQATSEDAFAARARGIPTDRVRSLSYLLSGAVGGLAGFTAGQLTFAYFALGLSLTLNGFIALAVGGLGSNLGALVGGAGAWAAFRLRDLPVRRRVPADDRGRPSDARSSSAAGGPLRRQTGAPGMTRGRAKWALALVFGIVLVSLPYWVRDLYQLHLASLIGAYWVLIAGLNLVVGYTGQLSIGHVGLLAVGVLLLRYPGWQARAGSAALDGDLRSARRACRRGSRTSFARLPGFYFAMATMAFALIVTELSLAQGDVTGGGIGPLGSGLLRAIRHPMGQLLANPGDRDAYHLAHLECRPSMWGRALIAVRDSEVAAASVGVGIFRLKLTVFIFSGVTAGIGGALFASLQSYITPDTFVFEIGLFFFVCIIIGGRGTILGPFIGTVDPHRPARARGPAREVWNLLLRTDPACGRPADSGRLRPLGRACRRSVQRRAAPKP